MTKKENLCKSNKLTVKLQKMTNNEIIIIIDECGIRKDEANLCVSIHPAAEPERRRSVLRSVFVVCSQYVLPAQNI